MSPQTRARFFARRLATTSVFDPIGDLVGRLRDIVIIPRQTGAPRIVGLVVEVAARRRVFVPITRVTAIDAGQIITNGVVNMRRFEKRSAEVLVFGEVLERTVTLLDGSGTASVEDIGFEHHHTGEWLLSRLHLRRTTTGMSRLIKRGQTITVPYREVTGLFGTQEEQSAAMLFASYEDLKAADMADVFLDLDLKRQVELAAELTDERLADVAEELPEDARVSLLSALEAARAADVLDAMDPDDAADVIQELPTQKAGELLDLMQPDEAEDVRRLMMYDEYTAGGMMTTEPLIASPETPVAHALAMLRREELSPAIAAVVYVCRQPLETPTGPLVGMVHFQRLLREVPDRALGDVIDDDPVTIAPGAPLSEVTRMMATYNMVNIGVVDAAHSLLGAVTVDDVLDHVLPDDWREEETPPEPSPITGTLPVIKTVGGDRT